MNQLVTQRFGGWLCSEKTQETDETDGWTTNQQNIVEENDDK